MRPRRGRRRTQSRNLSTSKRQGALLLQPGGGGVLSGGGGGQAPSAAVNSNQETGAVVQSNLPAGTGGNAAGQNPVNSLTHVQSQSLSSLQTSGTSSPPSTSASLSTVLFGPDAANTVVSSSPSLSAPMSSLASNPPTATSGLGISSTATSSSPPGNSSGRVAASIASASQASISPTASSFVASTSQSSASASAAPVNDVSPSTSSHSTLVVGVVFLVIVGAACLLSFGAWLFRSRRRKPKWCCGQHEDNDMENQDIGFGLGIFLDKPMEDNVSPRIPSTSTSEKIVLPKMSMGVSLPYALPPLNGFASAPGPAMRPPQPIKHSLDPAEPPGQGLGTLQVKNYMPGDFSSSCDEGTRANSRQDERSSVEFSSPQMMSTPRYLRFAGQAPNHNMSWAPPSPKSVRLPTNVSIRRAASRRSSDAYPGPKNAEDMIPPLPLPQFGNEYGLSSAECSGTDSWGATLRSSFFSAISAVAGVPSANSGEDHYTTVPERTMAEARRSESLSKSSSGQGLPEVDIGSSTIHSIEPFSLDGRDDLGHQAQVAATAPLVVRKKSTMRSGSQTMPLLNTQSVYSSSTIIYTPQQLSGAKLPHRNNSFGSTPPSARVRTSLRKPMRPTFLARISSSGASFSSEATDDASKDLTDEELLAKRVLVLRARRKKAMARTSAMGRQLSIQTPTCSPKHAEDCAKAS